MEVKSHSLNFKAFVETIPFDLQVELGDLLADIPGGFTEDVGAGLAIAYAKGNKISSQMVREVPINQSKFNAQFM